jgi:hypothetical protein
MGIAARVKFHGVGTKLAGAENAVRVGIDEKAGADACVPQAEEIPLQSRGIGGDVESPFGGYLLSSLRHDRYLVGAQTLGERYHLFCAGNLQIEHGRHGCGDCVDVLVLHVTPIFAQVSSDAVGARPLTEWDGLDWNRFMAAARLSQCRDVIDVYIEPLFNACHMTGSMSLVAAQCGVASHHLRGEDE